MYRLASDHVIVVFGNVPAASEELLLSSGDSTLIMLLWPLVAYHEHLVLVRAASDDVAVAFGYAP